MFFVMFVAKYDSNEDLDIEKIMNADKYDEKVVYAAFNNDNYKNALKTWLPFFNKRGYLDTLLPNAPLTPFMTALMQQMPQPPLMGIDTEIPMINNDFEPA